jgi:hypothetical protein
MESLHLGYRRGRDVLLRSIRKLLKIHGSVGRRHSPVFGVPIMRCLIYGRQIIAVIDLSIAMAIGVGAASAQTPKVPTPALPLSDSSVGQIMSVARRRGDVPGSVVSNILRQRYNQYPAAKREALADSVVEFAIHSARSADQAIIALAIAGRADPGIGGVPYQAAQQQLIRISREAVSVL